MVKERLAMISGAVAVNKVGGLSCGSLSVQLPPRDAQHATTALDEGVLSVFAGLTCTAWNSVSLRARSGPVSADRFQRTERAR